MNKHWIKLVALVITFVVGIIYGILIQKYQYFPYKLLKTAYHSILKKPHINLPWSIGIYEGSTPFNLAGPENITNPVLTIKDVVDIDAAFIADPFMAFNNGNYFLFFEVFNRETKQGDIAYAESSDGRRWEYKKIVIDEKFHLSYPHIFEWDNNYYLIPESHEDFSVRLYKAVRFPDKWQYVGNLLSGYRYVDPSIFRYNDKWWMFVCTGESNVLNLYYSNDLLTGWKNHPMNPIVKLDKNFARPGGRVITYENKLYRLTQDDEPVYGTQVFAFEITDLSETTYTDKLASTNPIVSKTGTGWNGSGMHHVDLHKIGNKWIASVDGRSLPSDN